MATVLSIASHAPKISNKMALVNLAELTAIQGKMKPSLPIANISNVLKTISNLAQAQLSRQSDCANPKLAKQARECMSMTDKDIAYAAANWTRTVLFENI